MGQFSSANTTSSSDRVSPSNLGSFPSVPYRNSIPEVPTEPLSRILATKTSVFSQERSRQTLHRDNAPKPLSADYARDPSWLTELTAIVSPNDVNNASCVANEKEILQTALRYTLADLADRGDTRIPNLVQFGTFRGRQIKELDRLTTTYNAPVNVMGVFYPEGLAETWGDPERFPRGGLRPNVGELLETGPRGIELRPVTVPGEEKVLVYQFLRERHATPSIDLLLIDTCTHARTLRILDDLAAEKMIRPGTVIVFDEFQQVIAGEERRAFLEFLGKNSQIGCQLLCLNGNHQQAAFVL